MDTPEFQQLLSLEENLAAATSSLSVGSSSELLFAQIESIAANHSSSSHTEELTKEDVSKLLNSFNSSKLVQSCTVCHQALFEDDLSAKLNEHKQGLEACCLNTFNQTYSDLEICFWWFLINNFTSCTLTLPNYTRFMLSTGGIPCQLRNRVWGILTQASDSSGVVDEYLENLYGSLNNDISPDLRIILKDINRTFPELSMFNDFETKCKFEKVLNAFSIYDSDMGYCQGLQFIVGPFLFHYNGEDKDELKTFNSVVNFFEINKLRNIYDNEMSDLSLWFYKFEQLMKTEIPTLSSHFENLEIDLNLFLSQWFLSFYSITIPFNFLIRMFDVMLFEGVEQTLLRAGLVILQKNASLLSNIDTAELIYQHLLSENCWGVFNNNVDDFIGSILNLPVESFNNESLCLLKEQYEKLNEFKDQSMKNKTSFNVNLLKSLSNLKNSAESIFSSSSSNHESTLSSSESVNSIENELFSNNNSNISISTSIPESNLKDSPDFGLLQELYKLCLDNGLKSPVLERVKERLSL